MLERDLAEQFTTIFEDYPLLVPNNNSQAGWPDRFIQLSRSRVIAAELKVGHLNNSKYYVMTSFRQTQAAWMAKWQRNGGMGLLFVGIEHKGCKIGYNIITCDSWRDWLKVNAMQYQLSEMDLHVSYESVRGWFAERYEGNANGYATSKHGANSIQ